MGIQRLTEEQKVFAEENHNLIYTFLNKKNLSIDEYYDVVVMGYLKAVANYDPSRGATFSTYAFFCMNNSVNMHYRAGVNKANKWDISFTGLEDPLFDNLTVGEVIPHCEDVESLFRYEEYIKAINSLPPQLREIIMMRIEGFSQAEIAKKVGLSQGYVSRLITKALKEIKKYGV